MGQRRNFFWLTLGVVISFNAIASDALMVFRQMIESDLKGDPTARLLLAASNARLIVDTTRQTDNKRISFDLDADALEVATAWSVDEVAGQCHSRVCDIFVKYEVVATTVGIGVPSWQQKQGRELRLLDQSVIRTERYRLENKKGRWEISRFFPPYVSPNALRNFFIREKLAVESQEIDEKADQRARINSEIVRIWRDRQIETLRQLGE
jgi:hypothetical protein